MIDLPGRTWKAVHQEDFGVFGVKSREDREASARHYQEQENSILADAGFEPTEGGLWSKSSVLFGRQAALQTVTKELGEHL